MIIECQSCHARFRLDATKIRGKGARVRCRRCGDSIIVLLEGQKEDAPPASGTGGFLDLGSVVRESLAGPPAGPPPAPASPPPGNLIPFPGPVKTMEPPSPRPAESPPVAGPPPFPAAGGEADDVDLVFGRRIPETGGPRPAESPSPETAGDAAEADDSPPAVPPAERLAATEPRETGFSPGTVSAEAAIDPGPGGATGPLSLESHQAPAGTEAPPFPGEGGFLLSDSETLDFLNEERRREEPPEAGGSRTDDISLFLSSVPADGSAPSLRAASQAAAPVAGTGSPDDISFRVGPAPPPAAAAAEMAIEGNETPVAIPPESPVPVPPLREESPADPRSEVRMPPRGETPGADRSSSPARVVAAGLAVLVLCGVGYLGFTEGGRKTLAAVAPGAAALLGGKDAATRGPALDVRNVIGYFDTAAGNARVLVIKGQVTNLSRKEKSGIRVFAAILDNAEKPIAEQAVYAGNVIPGERLRKTSREEAEKILGNRFGEGLANMSIGPGKSVPFMVVFFDAPENIDSYRLEARDGD